MKRLFLTTTVLALGAISASSAHSFEVKSLTSAEFTQMSEVVKTSSITASFYGGDFQINAKAAIAQNLYRGEGSSLMQTIRLYRD